MREKLNRKEMLQCCYSMYGTLSVFLFSLLPGNCLLYLCCSNSPIVFLLLKHFFPLPNLVAGMGIWHGLWYSRVGWKNGKHRTGRKRNYLHLKQEEYSKRKKHSVCVAGKTKRKKRRGTLHFYFPLLASIMVLLCLVFVYPQGSGEKAGVMRGGDIRTNGPSRMTAEMPKSKQATCEQSNQKRPEYLKYVNTFVNKCKTLY